MNLNFVYFDGLFSVMSNFPGYYSLEFYSFDLFSSNMNGDHQVMCMGL